MFQMIAIMKILMKMKVKRTCDKNVFVSNGAARFCELSELCRTRKIFKTKTEKLLERAIKLIRANQIDEM
jgi:hypothetical protein